MKFGTVKDHGHTNVFWISSFFDEAFEYGDGAKFVFLVKMLNHKLQNQIFVNCIHPSTQWRYSPNRALASSVEVP
jgi:hypothetical protein